MPPFCIDVVHRGMLRPHTHGAISPTILLAVPGFLFFLIRLQKITDKMQESPVILSLISPGVVAGLRVSYACCMHIHVCMCVTMI